MSGSKPDDVRRIGTDPATFEAFYRTHADAVERFVVRRVHDPHLSADLTADVFLAAIDSADGYRPSRGKPAAWLYGPARNVLASDRRRHGRELDEAQPLNGRRLPDDDDIARMEERIDAEAQAGRPYLAHSIGDAARALGIRPATARVRLHRPRRRLQDHLSPFAAESTVPRPHPSKAAS